MTKNSKTISKNELDENFNIIFKGFRETFEFN